MSVPPDSGAAIRLDEPAHIAGAENRAGLWLVVFMRLLAGLWVLQGLMQWAAILLPPESLLDTVSAARGAAVVFFAIFDFVAAVGLWLAVPWGGVIWLLGAIAQIVVALTIPGFFSVLWVGANFVLIMIYFVLTWQAGHAASAAGLLLRR
ncbi:MAG TPA: hypothetical protein VL996_00810 [Methylocella sp.]|nr:hypothetical protein [Methylocella sp.]